MPPEALIYTCVLHAEALTHLVHTCMVLGNVNILALPLMLIAMLFTSVVGYCCFLDGSEVP